jgi:hypothetical protein
MENATSIAHHLHHHDTTEPSVVLMYVLGLLQGVCGYYLPMSTVVLWYALGIGAFFTGWIYLQYLYSTHFFVDAQVSLLMHSLTAESNACATHPHRHCYNTTAQDIATFFLVVAAHGLVYGKKPKLTLNNAIVVTAFFVYGITMTVAQKSVAGRWVTIASFAVGAVLGTSKVLFYKAVIHPVCIAIGTRLFSSQSPIQPFLLSPPLIQQPLSLQTIV